MRALSWWFLGVGLVFTLGGCGDGGGGTGGASGIGGTSGAGGAAGVGGSPPTATLTGTVLDGGDESSTPLEAATVSVVGTSRSAMTDTSGRWTLEAPQGEVYLQASAGGYWSSIVRREVPSEGLTDVELEVIGDALVSGIGTALGTSIDETKGIVLVAFDPVGPVGGQTATLSEGFDFSFSFDGAEDPQLTDALLTGGDSDLIFVGVGLTNALTVGPEGASAGENCFVRFGATPPILERSITRVAVPCQLSIGP